MIRWKHKYDWNTGRYEDLWFTFNGQPQTRRPIVLKEEQISRSKLLWLQLKWNWHKICDGAEIIPEDHAENECIDEMYGCIYEWHHPGVHSEREGRAATIRHTRKLPVLVPDLPRPSNQIIWDGGREGRPVRTIQEGWRKTGGFLLSCKLTTHWAWAHHDS